MRSILSSTPTFRRRQLPVVPYASTVQVPVVVVCVSLLPRTTTTNQSRSGTTITGSSSAIRCCSHIYYSNNRNRHFVIPSTIATTTPTLQRQQQQQQQVQWNTTITLRSSSSTSTSSSSSSVATTTEESQDDIDTKRYNELLDEYNTIVKEKVPRVVLQLYRSIMRSIYKQLKYGNEHDRDEFKKREEKQRQSMLREDRQLQHQFDAAMKKHSTNTTTTAATATAAASSSSTGSSSDTQITVADDTELSLVDTLPIDRDDELQSRMDYYIQYAREQFTQNSDSFLVHDLVQPVNKVRQQKRHQSYYSTYINDSNRAVSLYQSGPGGNKYLPVDMDGPDSNSCYVQYSIDRDDQYELVERWNHVIQQGYIHHDWLLKDMKFNAANAAAASKDGTKKDTTPTMTSSIHKITQKRNRIHTSMSKVDISRQREITEIQEQLQNYIDRVLKFNYDITMNSTKSTKTTTANNNNTAAAAAAAAGTTRLNVDGSSSSSSNDNNDNDTESCYYDDVSDEFVPQESIWSDDEEDDD